jgi:hypothetical protein
LLYALIRDILITSAAARRAISTSSCAITIIRETNHYVLHAVCICSIEAADKRKNWRGVVIAVQDMKEFGHGAGTGEATARALSQAACLRAIKSLHGHGRWWEVFDAADTLTEVRLIRNTHAGS